MHVDTTHHAAQAEYARKAIADLMVNRERWSPMSRLAPVVLAVGIAAETDLTSPDGWNGITAERLAMLTGRDYLGHELHELVELGVIVHAGGQSGGPFARYRFPEA